MRPTSQPSHNRIFLSTITSYMPGGSKTLTYAVETGSGTVSLYVEVPYHPDDREADRLGRIELRRLLATLATAA